MGKLETVIATGITIKEGVNEILDLFDISISSKYYESLDTLTFLDSKILGLGSDGKIIDSTKIIGEAIYNLSNLVIWGIIIYYLFLSLFSYFLSKKVEMPWQIFIRNVICGVLINASFFICYSAVYLTENATCYITESCGGNTSFAYLEDKSYELDMVVNEEIENVFIMDELIKIAMYISLLFLNIVTGIRFIVIKLFILFSPLIFALGCSKSTEKTMFKLITMFIKLLVYQIIIAVILEIVLRVNFIEETILRVLIISTMLICIRFMKKI